MNTNECIITIVSFTLVIGLVILASLSTDKRTKTTNHKVIHKTN